MFKRWNPFASCENITFLSLKRGKHDYIAILTRVFCEQHSCTEHVKLKQCSYKYTVHPILLFT